jgi:hypothetical protein
MPKVHQEFYCRHCPADDPGSKDPEKQRRGGHFRLMLEVGFDASVTVHCPKCGHTHSRHVKGGVIHDGAGSGDPVMLKVGLSAWSREAMSELQAKARREQPQDDYQAAIRGGAVIKDDGDKNDGWDAYRRNLMAQRWAEVAAGGSD